MKIRILYIIVCFSVFLGNSLHAQSKVNSSSIKQNTNSNRNKNDKTFSSSNFIRVDSTVSYFNYLVQEYFVSKLENKKYDALLKAYTVNPNDIIIQYELTKFYENQNNSSEKKKILLKLKSFTSSELLAYGKNLLASIEQNGFLVTYGEKDTYPAWIAQEIDGYRTDVKIIHFDLFIDPIYRSRILQKHQLNLSSIPKSRVEILKLFAKENEHRNIYFSSAISPKLLRDVSANLFCTGLAFKYSIHPEDNMNALYHNWQTNFDMKDLSKSKFHSDAKAMMMNYIYPFFLLVQDERLKNNEKKELTKIIENIARQNNKENIITEKLKTIK